MVAGTTPQTRCYDSRAMAERPSREEIRRRVLEDRPSFVIPVEVPDPPVTPRDSATVILLRDGDRGLDVFMLERHLRSDFAGGAYVFPGGTIDHRDTDPAAAVFVDGPIEDDLPFRLCAIRETFEEAGVLLARRDGEPVDLSDADRFASYRRDFNARSGSLAALAEAEGIRYAGDALHYYGRWITPEFSPKRYDTRFFVAAMPEGQEPLHDDVETTASTWIRPIDALSQAAEGLFSIIFPTRKTLESLTKFATVGEVVASTLGRRIEPILPVVVLNDGQARVVLPGDSTLHEP
jgi:8-oxo-dGTP pyrophosphatase MutT (NUDIX family)